MDNKTDSKPVLCDSKYLLLSSYHRARKRCPDCLLILKRKRLFAGGPPANKNLFAGGPLANKKLFAGGPPAIKNLFTVPNAHVLTYLVLYGFVRGS